MSDEAEFLKAICREPADDTSRLVYADWLDENPLPEVPCKFSQCRQGRIYTGMDGMKWVPCSYCGETATVPDRSRGARAEFIRVQCELARHPRDSEVCLCGYEPRDGYHHNSPTCPYVRSDALLKQYGAAWAAVPCPACGGYGDRHVGMVNVDDPHFGHKYRCEVCKGTGRCPVEWSRGFVSAVTCARLEDVVEQPICTNCQGTGRNPNGVGNTCFYCSDTGLAPDYAPTPWALAAARAHPVEEFRCGGREPLGSGGRFEWLNGDMYVTDGYPADAISLAVIPTVVFNALEGGARGGLPFRVYYPTREAALTALYRALAIFVRRGIKWEALA